MFVLQDIVFERENAYSLHVENLTIEEGEKIALIGPSGSGKSTALDLLGLLLQPKDAGKFLLNTPNGVVDILAMWRQSRTKAQDSLAKIRQKTMGYVLQTGGLFPFLSVYENMALHVRAMGKKVEKKEIAILAERLKISHLLYAKPSILSVGERQRVAIVRALAPKPSILLADEPTSALDPPLAQEVLGLFLEQAASSTLIMVTHNRELANRLHLRPLALTVTREENEPAFARMEFLHG